MWDFNRENTGNATTWGGFHVTRKSMPIFYILPYYTIGYFLKHPYYGMLMASKFYKLLREIYGNQGTNSG